jgi:alkanesulfonate monooxygenase SsuD/methylene tetrahydromethanopterin reductase-like flavin-dependent oxidoreductase (luciferase family)
VRRRGPAAVPVFGRHPLLVSSQAQTAQAATGGRFHLGLALGTKQWSESAFGVPYERPIGRLREFLTALRQLVETGGADFHGELLTATTPLSAAVPSAEPPVPWWSSLPEPRSKTSVRVRDRRSWYVSGSEPPLFDFGPSAVPRPSGACYVS